MNNETLAVFFYPTDGSLSARQGHRTFDVDELRVSRSEDGRFSLKITETSGKTTAFERTVPEAERVRAQVEQFLRREDGVCDD